MITASCPNCGTENLLGSDPEIGMQMECPKCQKVLEIIWLFPPMLDNIDVDIEHRIHETNIIDH